MATRAVTEKRLTIVVYGADRQLWAGGTLRVTVRDLFRGLDLHGEDVRGSIVEVRLELPFDAGQLYGLRLSRPGHRPAWYALSRQSFIRDGRVERDEVVLRLMLVPDDAESFDLAGGFGRLVERRSPFTRSGSGLEIGQYLALEPPLKMALLNIEAKLRETLLDGTPVLDFVRGVRLVEPDRVYLWVLAEAKNGVRRSPDFANAAGHGLRADRPELPAHPHSSKHTRFEEGNLQLSFAEQVEDVAVPGEIPASCFSVDADIDLARGPGHAAEWLRNNVFERGHKTDQRDVYGLLYPQGILPVYTLAQRERRLRVA